MTPVFQHGASLVYIIGPLCTENTSGFQGTKAGNADDFFVVSLDKFSTNSQKANEKKNTLAIMIHPNGVTP